MAATTGIKITAAALQVENDTLKSTVEALRERLTQVADALAKVGLINDTPHDRYRLVHGEALYNFPKTQAEFIDIDDLMSDL